MVVWPEHTAIKFLFIIIIISKRRVISKRDECEYLKQLQSIDGCLELV
jgi:hypothetical protein